MKLPCGAKHPRLCFLPARWSRKLRRDSDFHYLNEYHRCQGVACQQQPRSSGSIVIRQDEADRIEPIGKIVGDNGESHQHTSLGTDLKPQSDAETISEAVPN